MKFYWRWEVEEMAQWIKHLLSKPEDQHLGFWHAYKSLVARWAACFYVLWR